MKRILLLTTLSMAIISLQAQKTEYGLGLNANLTSMKGNGLSNTLTSGFSGGVFSRIHFNKKWNLQPEIDYNYTNTAKSGSFITYYVNSGNDDAATKIHLSYVSVPLLLGYQVKNYLTINAGPQYSFMMYEDDNLLKNNRAAFKRNDLGIAAGAQIKLEGSSFYARYVMGVLNINNVDDRYNWHNRQVQLGMTLKLF